MDQSEHVRIRNTLTQTCPAEQIGAWTEPVVAPPPSSCDPSHPTACIAPPPDLDCGDIPHRDFAVIGDDPHRFDTNNDGIGCSS
jgi:hypothetical protein